MPPDRHFVVDRLPDHPNVIVMLGAAHGFKFSSLFGRILSELCIDGETKYDIEHFKADRNLLTMANPPRSFLV
jgi:sarcosine oxidase